MQVGRLQVQNFRGIATLDWYPAGKTLCCLIGPGDSAKSSVLDAIEAVLSSRWFSFNEADFHLCDTTKSIVIEVTVGELSKALLSDERFGLYVRGWPQVGAINDEPEDGDEPVLTVRLTVDATMEPVWELVCDRAPHPRTLSNRDRALFGVVRLAGDDARHLTWGQGSVLAKLTDNTDDAAKHLADAYRLAKSSANLGAIEGLADASAEAERRARAIGAYVEGTYSPGLELGRGGFSTGSIALHDGSVPLRLAGLGTRRLATLAIQRSTIGDGAIVLVDEIEHGLEPHRIIGAIVHLKAAQKTSVDDGVAVGQVMMTTHSDVALTELRASSLYVARRDPVTRSVSLLNASDEGQFGRLLKKAPRALFARRVLVCEGDTELGLVLGLREGFPKRHGNVPIEQLGVAVVDGNGAEAPSIALAFAALGFQTAIFRDSDRVLTTSQAAELTAAGVVVFQYDGKLNTEQALFQAANDLQIQALVESAREEKGADAINAQLRQAVPSLAPFDLSDPVSEWDVWVDFGPAGKASVLAQVATDMKWFKTRAMGRTIAPVVEIMTATAPLSSIAKCIGQFEGWMYA